MNAANTGLYEFGEFRLDASERTLTKDGTVVPLAPKVFDTLEILVTRSGSVISKKELMEILWPDAFVEESNLSQNIYTIRKALGNGDGIGHLIENVPRRGYRFNAEVREVDASISTSGTRPWSVPEGSQIAADELPTPSGARFRWVSVAVGLLLVGATALGAYLITTRTGGASETVIAEQSTKPEAMQAYTRGMAILGRRGNDNRPEDAIDEFQKAVTLDPTFARGYAGLAEGFAAAARKAEFPESTELYNKAKAAVQRALSLDPNSSEAYLASGLVRRSADWDWSGAESDLRRSIQLTSKNAQAHQRLGQLLSSLSRHDEALSAVTIASDLDPIGDYALGARFPILEAKRDYDTGLREAEKFHRENKSNANAARAYGTFLYLKGDYPKMIELGERVIGTEQAKNAFAWYSLLHASYAKSLENDKADHYLGLLAGLTAKDSKARYSLAMNYAELGRTNEAIQLLEDCYAAREERMTWLNVEPRFENLRTEERFRDLLRKMKFL
jgi:DNA-binding winged helix-turn-helix (wHTH) protein/tetratricopeptide (TPR) repeat protein